MLVLCCVSACAQREPGPGIDVDRALGLVRTLASPRPHDTPAARVALHTIEDQLTADNIEFDEMRTGTVELPAIEVLGTSYRQAQSLTVEDPDLLVRFGPPGKALLVMAHYDSVPGSPGACDNAAAVAILVELARILHATPPRQPVILAFTAAEESGLAGAEALATKLGDDIDFAIALDLVGGDGPLVLNGASTLIGRAELGWLHDAAGVAGVELTAPIPHRIVSRWWPQAERSDHGPFTRRGVRAVHFYNRGNDGEWIDRAYHSPSDQWPRVHRESVAAVGQLVRALVASPVPGHTGDGFWVPLAHVVIPRWLLVALELALAIVTLLAVARHRGPRALGAGLLIGASCYVLALAVAIGIERVALPAAGAWLLSPLRMTIASVLVFGGAFGLVTRAAARFWPWAGVDRYRAFAALACTAVGLMCMVIGAAEIAWVWLVPAVV
ncbi:MAG TPA: M28 family metallopeptidase, partial [Kofleriaceae bacterium]|nr:M28 family metallopeptidase [Kofleriaceae bacterium]